MRTKSSPLRAKTVATPPVLALNLSTGLKLLFSASPPLRSTPLATSSVNALAKPSAKLA